MISVEDIFYLLNPNKFLSFANISIVYELFGSKN